MYLSMIAFPNPLGEKVQSRMKIFRERLPKADSFEKLIKITEKGIEVLKILLTH